MQEQIDFQRLTPEELSSRLTSPESLRQAVRVLPQLNQDQRAATAEAFYNVYASSPGRLPGSDQEISLYEALNEGILTRLEAIRQFVGQVAQTACASEKPPALAELGTGTAQTLALMVKAMQERGTEPRAVIGLELSEKMAEIAQKRINNIGLPPQTPTAIIIGRMQKTIPQMQDYLGPENLFIFGNWPFSGMPENEIEDIFRQAKHIGASHLAIHEIDPRGNPNSVSAKINEMFLTIEQIASMARSGQNIRQAISDKTRLIAAMIGYGEIYKTLFQETQLPPEKMEQLAVNQGWQIVDRGTTMRNSAYWFIAQNPGL